MIYYPKHYASLGIACWLFNRVFLKGLEMAEPIQGICVYCRQFTEVTLDHVIPQCLWPGRVPKDAPVVNACKACNHQNKSGDDTYLRDILVTNSRSSDTPIAQKLFPKFGRAMERNQSQLANDLQEHGQIRELYTSQGETTALVTSQEANERSERIFTTITHGLYNYYTQANMPENVPIRVFILHDQENTELAKSLFLAGGGVYKRAGDGSVFECLYIVSPSDSYTSAWSINLLRRVRVIMLTGTLTTIIDEGLGIAS